MLSSAQSIFVIIFFVILSVSFLLVLNRLWLPERRRNHNDVFAWQFNFLGTAYGVIISFMLLTAWTDFSAAELNADQESNAIVDLSRIADGLPTQQRDILQALAKEYVDVVLTKEWPEMDRANGSNAGRSVVDQLWRTLTQPSFVASAPSPIIDRALAQLSTMTEHRRIRQEQAAQHLPDMLWAILILGSVLTISYACLFGAESLSVHAFQVFGLALLIALCLVTIADLSRPYQGAAHVKPDAFLRARDSIRQSALRP